MNDAVRELYRQLVETLANPIGKAGFLVTRTEIDEQPLAAGGAHLITVWAKRKPNGKRQVSLDCRVVAHMLPNGHWTQAVAVYLSAHQALFVEAPIRPSEVSYPLIPLDHLNTFLRKMRNKKDRTWSIAKSHVGKHRDAYRPFHAVFRALHEEHTPAPQEV